MTTTKYDTNNIFAKILRNEIPNKTIFENEYALSFYDINPVTKIHAIVIPKNPYIDYSDFISTASKNEIIEFNNAVITVVKKLNLQKNGYRIVTNIGNDGNQEIPHLHYHILGGEKLYKLI